MIGELRQSFDWVLCDSPAGIERGAQLAMRFADEAIVVTNPEVSSVRDSDRIIGLLDAKTRRAEAGERMEKRLLLTRFDPARSSRGEMLSVADVLDILSIPLHRHHPGRSRRSCAPRTSARRSPSTARRAPRPAPITTPRAASSASAAPIVIPGEKKTLFNRLFSRRAA